MLKFIFGTLLLANTALLAFNWDAPDAALSERREPERLKLQIHPEQLTVLAAREKTAAAAAPAPASAIPAPAPAGPGATTAAAPAPIVCTEIGVFPPAEAKRFEAQLAALALGERQSRRNLSKVSSYLVYIPSPGDQAGAQKNVAELRQRGVTDFFIMQDNSDMRWGISLGLFKTEAGAKKLLASLQQQGVQSAKIGTRAAATGNVAFQLRDLDPAGMAALDRIAADFPKQQRRNCE